MPHKKRTKPTQPRKTAIKEKLVSFASNKKAVLLTALALAAALLTTFFILLDLPSPTTLKKDVYPVSTKILDRNGKLLYEIYADQNRTPVSIEDLPEHVIQATIAIEDKNFYSHHGFDTQGILRAALRTLSGKRLEGGSTITQQLVKVALLTPERTVERKLKEAILALATEVLYTKNQILEMYLNHIPYGGTAYGVEAAAHLYFNKSARDLTLEEASLLAGLPQAPTRYSPFSNPDAARTRQGQVLNRMVEDGFIDQQEADEAKSRQLNLAQPFTNIKAPHFVMYVRERLEEKYGVQRVEQGGLRVTTTLDLELQEAAQASLSAEIEQLENLRVSNGASLVTNPKTGEILAMVGSRDYFDAEIDGKVNVTTRERQPGSSIKPLNYALGLETKVLTPSTMLLDTEICFRVEGQPEYCPNNYDNTYHATVLIRTALASSYNIPAVKVLALNSIENFMAFARRLGITTWQDPANYGLSLTLGGGEVKMTDMAVAFGVFANNGTRVSLQPILKVENHRGEILEEYRPQETATLVDESKEKEPQSDPIGTNGGLEIRKVLSPQTAFLISHILADNSARAPAFGTNSVLNIPGKTVSVKTGTTNNLRDNWTIGYTETRLVATWVGNNDNTPMSYIASGITGASPIWQDIMRYALQGIDPAPLEVPNGVITALVCQTSGVIPTGTDEEGCPTRLEYFLDGTVPTVSRIEKKEIWINRDTGLPPEGEEEFANIELQEHLVASDPFTTEYCLDCTPTEQQETPEEGSPPEENQKDKQKQRTNVIYTPGAFTINDQ